MSLTILQIFACKVFQTAEQTRLKFNIVNFQYTDIREDFFVPHAVFKVLTFLLRTFYKQKIILLLIMSAKRNISFKIHNKMEDDL